MSVQQKLSNAKKVFLVHTLLKLELIPYVDRDAGGGKTNRKTTAAGVTSTMDKGGMPIYLVR